MQGNRDGDSLRVVFLAPRGIHERFGRRATFVVY